MRGKWGSSSARFGVGQETLRRPLPGLGCRYPTAAPSHTPLPLLSPRALVEKTGRKRARRPGRLWGDGGGDDRRAGAGAGSAAGDGAGSPQRRAGPCPLQEPFRSVTWDPSPELAAPAGASAVAERQACSGGPRGERSEALRRPSADPDLRGLARPALAEGDAGGGSSGRAPGSRGGRGARGRDATLLCFHWSLVVGAGGREKCLFVGPKNIHGLAKGPRNEII